MQQDVCDKTQINIILRWEELKIFFLKPEKDKNTDFQHSIGSQSDR